MKYAAIVLAGLFSSVGLARDIANFGMSKRGVYVQTENGAVTPDVFDVSFRVMFWTANAFEAGSAQSPSFGPVVLLGYDDLGLYGWDGYFSSSAQMEAAYPASDVTFSMSGGLLGERTETIGLPESIFSVNVPRFTGDSASRLWEIEPGVEFNGTIAPCTQEPTSDYAFGTFYVIDLSNGGSAWYQSLEPGENSISIPAGSIVADRAYLAVLTNENRVQTPNAGFDGAIGEMIFTQETRMFFNTRGSCPADLNDDGLVEDSDFSLFAVAYNALSCSGGTQPGCPADLTNDGWVMDDDFSVFVLAYDALLCE